jgi:ribose/xylose/arabinose/galactoside ABC-type transport system permease subunit
MGLLLVVLVTLLWSWADNLGSPSPAEAPEVQQFVSPEQIQYLTNVPGQMASMYLLLALGFALALRCGAIDLSIWTSAGAGGVVAAASINAGVAPTLAFAAACGTGLALGAFNGAMVGGLRLPSVLVTLATAVAGMWLMHWLIGSKSIAVPAGSFGGLSILPYPPLLVGRMLIVAAAYSVAMLALVVLDSAIGRGVHFGRRVQLLAALTASGALAGLAGACWLIDRNQAPLPSAVIGDLRAPAAAVLAGAAFFAGRSRTLLVGIALPPALLAATIWRQQAWLAPYLSPAWHMALLIIATLVAQLTLGLVFLKGRPGSPSV